MNNDFEKAYQSFLDEQAYDEAAAAFFPIARIAFKAGWIAAGGKMQGSFQDAAAPSCSISGQKSQNSHCSDC